MPYGLACSNRWGVECPGEISRPQCRHGMWWLLAEQHSRRFIEEHNNSTYLWRLESSEYGGHEFFGLHGPAGRPSVQLRRFRRHGLHRLLVVLLRLVRVQCLVPQPEQLHQCHLPQLRQPYVRFLGSLLQGLGQCVGEFDPWTIAPDLREGAREIGSYFRPLTSCIRTSTALASCVSRPSRKSR